MPHAPVVYPARALACALAWPLLLTFALAAAPVAAKDTARISAEEVFRRLPTSIFDNTPEPLAEEDKERLLDRGHTSAWVVVQKSPSVLRMSAMSELAGEVTLHLFRADFGGIAVLGAQTSDACAAELWRYDAHGGIVPDGGPTEPPPSDFFAPGRTLPPGVHPSYRLCLEDDRLEAKPLFWNNAGLVDITPDNRIFFAWNSTAFVKQVEPREALSSIPPEKK